MSDDLRDLVEGRINSEEYVRRLRARVAEDHERGGSMLPRPDEVQARAERIFRRYTIHVRYSGSLLFPWWATMTHGVFTVGESGGGVWHARSRDRLVEKCERWIRRDARRHGIQSPEIKVDERTP